MGDPSDMICFNVLRHMFEWPLLSTSITGGHSALPIAAYVTFSDHGPYLIVQFLEVHSDFVRWQCCNGFVIGEVVQC